MPLKSLLLLTVATIIQLFSAASASAQLVAYESFAGMTVGSGLIGSGTNATGWSDSGWANGSDPRYQTVDPIPDLTYEIAGGALLDGSNRAVQLTTNPEPVPSGLLSSRTFPEQNTTIYFSFLVRPVTVGTGSDTLYLRLSNGTSSLALVALQPEVGQQYFNLWLLLDGGSGGGGGSVQALYSSTTYLIVGRITWPGGNRVAVETWVNPPAAYPGNSSFRLDQFNLSGPPVFSSIGLGISSSDTGGPTSTAIFDELRIGYTWADVVLPGPPTANLGNISTRLRVETGDNVLIGGFIITGTQPKKVIIRAIGPALSSSFFPETLADPVLELHDSSGSLIRSNDNWRSDQEAEIIATGIPPYYDLESAIVATLPANNSAYTAIVRGVDNGTGIGVVEAYDLDGTVDSKLGNISTRGFVQTGDNVMIGGLIVQGQDPLRVIVRAIGPSLPVSGALGDPTLELHDGNGALIAANDNWRTDQEAEIIATTIPPSNDLESAIVRTLSSAAYTAIVRGVGGTTGIAVVEIYALN
jgi:hypothetical protein